ncbi:MAG: DUF802 domain-containing protein [Burkholderiales bacterium]|nr:DUF802 domain-containing protein [Burkholderiales bacterium]
MNRFLAYAAFALGLLAIAWVGSGYVPSNPLALALVLLIAAFYLAGALELWRFERSNAELERVLTATNEAPLTLGAWLAALPAGLRHAVRLRVEGERVALPGPALTPYLAGLLVLLGMLGTFLGMIVTLKGTGLALQNAGDVDAIRASLAAPVEGLGLAFGTSVAGVAASAALGLMSALARRERRAVVQRLDALAATTLRGFSHAHQREQSLRLLQAQADAMPALVGQLQALVARIDQQGQALHDGLLASQDRFQDEARRAYGGLAESVGHALEAGLAEGARLAGAAIEPAVRATMAGLEREALALRSALGGAVALQIEGVGARLDATAAELAAGWKGALAEQQRRDEAQAQGLNAGLERFASSFEQRSAALLDAVATRQDRAAALAAEASGRALAAQQQSQQALLLRTQEALAATLAGFEQQAQSLAGSVAASHAALLGSVADTQTALLGNAAESQTALLSRVADSQAALLDSVADHQTALLGKVTDEQRALLDHIDESQAALLASVAASHESLEAGAAARERARLAAIDAGLAALAERLQRQGDEAGQALAERQERICTTLERSALAITAGAQNQARSTIAEIEHLVQVAAQAPQAAAEVIAELRRALSDSLVHDNAMLEERNRLLATLGGLLDALNHAGSEQRAAIDGLVRATAELLEDTGRRFAETVQVGSDSLQGVAAQVGAGAAEVASLGEGFGVAVQLFGRASEQLLAQLGRIETALGHSLARSDEQLAYYVAQAREIVDLTLGSHRQIVEDLQHLAKPGVPA